MKLSERAEVLRRIDKDIKAAQASMRYAYDAEQKLKGEQQEHADAAQKTGDEKSLKLVWSAAMAREWQLGSGLAWKTIEQRIMNLRLFVESLPIDDIPDPKAVVVPPQERARRSGPAKQAVEPTGAPKRGKAKRKR